MIVSICWILVTNFALFNSAQECVDKLDNCGLIAKRNLCEIQTYQRQCCISCGRQDSLPNNLLTNKKWVFCTEIYSFWLKFRESNFLLKKLLQHCIEKREISIIWKIFRDYKEKDTDNFTIKLFMLWQDMCRLWKLR